MVIHVSKNPSKKWLNLRSKEFYKLLKYDKKYMKAGEYRITYDDNNVEMIVLNAYEAYYLMVLAIVLPKLKVKDITFLRECTIK